MPVPSLSPDRRAPRAWRTARAIAALAALLGLCALIPATAAAALPAWTTYHRDAERSGSDPDGTSPLTPTLSWQSPNLGAPIWNQPLILGSRVYVATTGDSVYALDAASGAILWHASAGTAVPSSALPCGDVMPTVGIVGTPVIDQATGVLYAVADTWNGSTAQHLLEGFRLSDGARVLSTPVDPPGADPKAILQRTALNLDGPNVIFGFGGNDGDCSNYRGAVVSVPESGGAASSWQVPIDATTSTGGGAVWATGGPAVNGAGDIFASTGNPNPRSGKKANVFDDSDAVVELGPSLAPIGAFEPPSWEADSNSDRDLGSGAPELLPGGLLFEAGKNGTGYLLEQSISTGAKAVYEHQVCGGSGSFGGDSYSNGVIYMPCTNGTQAVAYNAAARTITPLWKGPSDAFGPPIISAGLVWAVGGHGSTLYGLELASGKTRYTETLPSAAADHFASPSAAGGRLLIATGSTVTAYQDAVLTAIETAVPGAGSTAPKTPPKATPTTPMLTLLDAAVHGGTAALHASARGAVHLLLRCPAGSTCRGSVTVRAAIRVLVRTGSSHRRTRLLHVEIAYARFGARHGQFPLVLHLGRGARALLRRHHHHLRVTLTLVLSGVSTRKVDAVLSG